MPRLQVDRLALTCVRRRREHRPPEDRDAGDQERARNEAQHDGVELPARMAFDDLEYPHAGDRRGNAADPEPQRDAHVDGAFAEMRPSPNRLGDRGVEDVRADRQHRLDPEDDDQQRCHERAATHTGGPHEDAHAEAEDDQKQRLGHRVPRVSLICISDRSNNTRL